MEKKRGKTKEFLGGMKTTKAVAEALRDFL